MWNLCKTFAFILTYFIQSNDFGLDGKFFFIMCHVCVMCVSCVILSFILDPIIIDSNKETFLSESVHFRITEKY